MVDLDGHSETTFGPSIADELAMQLWPERTLLAELPFEETPQRGLGRLAILELIHSRPGLHKMGICRATGLAWGTITYHLADLMAAGQVEEVREGKETYVFAKAVPVGHRRWLAVLQSDAVDRVVSVIAQHREASVGEIMARLSMSRKPIQRVIDRLAAADLVVKLGRGRLRYTLSDSWAVITQQAPSYGLNWISSLRVQKSAANTPTGPVLVTAPPSLLPPKPIAGVA